MTDLYAPRSGLRHLVGEGTRLPGRLPYMCRPQSAPRALCGAFAWPIDQLTADMVDHGLDEDQALRMRGVWNGRPLCSTCHDLKETT